MDGRAVGVVGRVWCAKGSTAAACSMGWHAAVREGRALGRCRRACSSVLLHILQRRNALAVHGCGVDTSVAIGDANCTKSRPHLMIDG